MQLLEGGCGLFYKKWRRRYILSHSVSKHLVIGHITPFAEDAAVDPIATRVQGLKILFGVVHRKLVFAESISGNSLKFRPAVIVILGFILFRENTDYFFLCKIRAISG